MCDHTGAVVHGSRQPAGLGALPTCAPAMGARIGLLRLEHCARAWTTFSPASSGRSCLPCEDPLLAPHRHRGAPGVCGKISCSARLPSSLSTAKRVHGALAQHIEKAAMHLRSMCWRTLQGALTGAPQRGKHGVSLKTFVLAANERASICGTHRALLITTSQSSC